MLLTIRKEPERFGLNEMSAGQLEASVLELEGRLMPSTCFVDIVEEERLACFDVQDLTAPRFLEELQGVASRMFSSLSARIATSAERPDDRRSTVNSPPPPLNSPPPR